MSKKIDDKKLENTQEIVVADEKKQDSKVQAMEEKEAKTGGEEQENETPGELVSQDALQGTGEQVDADKPLEENKANSDEELAEKNAALLEAEKEAAAIREKALKEAEEIIANAKAQASFGEISSADTASYSDYVDVYLAYPTNMKFDLSGRSITLNGANVRDIYKNENINKREGKFGITRIRKEDWEEILSKYGSMSKFKQNKIFANSVGDRGQAKEMVNIVTGFEQVNKNELGVKPFKKEE